jgi:hypothetical protein
MTERKLIEILILENQIEANRMKDTLEEHKIPFVIKEYTDLEYGNIKRKKGWGRLESYKEFEQQILDLYSEGFVYDPNEKTESIENMGETPEINQVKKGRVKEIIIVILLLSVSFLAYKTYELNQIITRAYNNKNFTHEHGRYSFRMKWKSSGNDYYLAQDEYDRGLFNKFSFYDPKGKLIYIGFDEDQDGINEKTIGLDTNNDTLRIFYDQNGDGIDDKSIVNLSKTLRLTFQDINFDRKWDTIIVNNKSYSVEQFEGIFKSN